MTNAEYAQNKIFIDYCTTANVKATSRQASKFKLKKGAVYRRAILGDDKCHVPVNAKIDEKMK